MNDVLTDLDERRERPCGEADLTKNPDFACFAKAILKHEPTFTLRAQDISAPDTIERWIDINEPILGHKHPKIMGARRIVAQMRAWPAARQCD